MMVDREDDARGRTWGARILAALVASGCLTSTGAEAPAADAGAKRPARPAPSALPPAPSSATTRPPPADAPPPPSPTLGHLSDGADARYPARVAMVTSADTRLRPGGPATDRRQGSRAVLVRPLVDEREGAVRVLSEDESVRLLVWLDRDQLTPVSGRDQPLLATPDGAPSETVVGAGLPVTVLDRRDGFAHIEHRRRLATYYSFEAGLVVVDGWVPEDGVADSFLPTPKLARSGGDDFVLTEPTSFVRSPQDTTPVGRVEAMDMQLVANVKATLVEGAFWQPVTLAEDDFTLRGYVPRRALQVPPSDRKRYPLQSWGGSGVVNPDEVWEEVAVDARTCLFDDVGTPVGVTLRPTCLRGAVDGDSGWWVHGLTEMDVSVRVRRADARTSPCTELPRNPPPETLPTGAWRCRDAREGARLGAP